VNDEVDAVDETERSAGGIEVEAAGQDLPRQDHHQEETRAATEDGRQTHCCRS
jgi:hypothetical protein